MNQESISENVDNPELPKAQTEKKNEFKMLSNFDNETHSHIIELGIVLSANHPVINDVKYLRDANEELQGMKAHV